MKRPLTDDQFVRLWMECESARDVCIRAGLSINYVFLRARGLRKKGVNLPHHLYREPNRTKQVDVEKLNRLVDKIEGGTHEQG